MLLHVSLGFAAKAKEMFSAEDPISALRELKSESLPQASFFVGVWGGWSYNKAVAQIRGQDGSGLDDAYYALGVVAPNC